MQKLAGKVETRFEVLLDHLYRGGAVGYWWSGPPDKKSYWWKAGAPAPLPGNTNIYFGVNPCSAIPSRKTPQNVRGAIDDIAAINCLFGEFDAKDFDGNKGKILSHIATISVKPSFVIDSGGGYHVYWLLREPFALASAADRQWARQLQAGWVKYVGSDDGAKDLARVLRVPGTFNAKYKPARQVTIWTAEMQNVYGLDELESMAMPKAKSTPAAAAVGNGNGASSQASPKYAITALENEYQKVRGAGEGSRNNQLNKSALALGQLVASGKLGESEVVRELTAAAKAVGLQDNEIAATIQSGLKKGKSQPRVIPERSKRESPAAASASANHGGAPARRFDLTDIGNGQRLAYQGKDFLLYVKAWGWLVWDGQRWETDNTGAIDRMAKTTAISIFDESASLVAEEKRAADELESAAAANDDSGVNLAKTRIQKSRKSIDEIRKWATLSQAYTRRQAMIADASNEPGIVARPEWFDLDTMLLNCKNGTLDLRTGQLRTHDQTDFITRLVPVEYDAGATCPTWLAFLESVFAGDKDLIAFIRRAVGYSLTGDDKEDCLFFLHGKGKNGKSTFCSAVQLLLGDYAKKTRAETLLSKRNADSSIPNDVADLAGARLVVAAELPQGRVLNESLVKDLTGRDIIKARFLRKEFFEFQTQFKLWMYGNHKPRIIGTDDGIWRRVKLIPFDVTFTKPDTKLGKKLQAEMPGILAWAVGGCLEWQRDGLGTPARVEDATAQYRTEQDEIGVFINECCVVQPNARASAADLHDAYVKWGGHMAARALGIVLGERGFTPDRGTAGARVWVGLGLLTK